MMARLNIAILPDELTNIEDMMRKMRHVERYRLARQFCQGKVVDIGCGCGYGTYLISQNPDVSHVVGIDPDPAMQDVRVRYSDLTFKVDFILSRFTKESFTHYQPNMAVMIEILEHIPNADEIVQLCYDLKIDKIVATVPAYKTTHFNSNHVKDYDIWEFKRLFLANGYSEVFPTIVQNNEVFFGYFQRIVKEG